jgi:hypothetical protein
MNAMVAGLSIELANSCENVDKYVDKCSKLWKSQKNAVVTKDVFCVMLMWSQGSRYVDDYDIMKLPGL